ncbi:copper transporter, partial [Xanthomonas oryzae pv. oryzae]
MAGLGCESSLNSTAVARAPAQPGHRAGSWL